jgi:hypothetical protein
MKRLSLGLCASLLAVILVTLFNWTLAVADEPAEPGEQANLRINEFMAANQFTLEDPDEPNEFPDWIELYNPGPGAVSLNGLFLSDSADRPTRYAIPPGLSIAPGGFLVFFADNDIEQGPLHLNFALNRNSGFISLFSGVTDQLIDSHSYGAQETDVSEGRQTDGGEPWRAFSPATPGATNSLLPPTISGVQQLPAEPSASDAVTITARVADDRGVALVTLFYSTTASGLVSVPMSDTGDLYVGVIPPLPDQTLVRYYLVVTDIDNLEGVAPVTAPRLPYRYLVGFRAPSVYLNEIMAANQGALVMPGQSDTFPDWFELYNPGPNEAVLDGLFLTDNRNTPTKYQIPSGVRIPPGGFIVFYADNEHTRGPTHTNFQLAREGEYLAIFANAELDPIDEIEYGELSINGVWSRFPDGGDEWVHTACYTPGAPNAPCELQALLPLLASN